MKEVHVVRALLGKMPIGSLHRLLFWSALVQAAGLAAATGVGIQLARFLGPTHYGVYGLIMSVVSIMVVVAQFGFPLLATKEAASAEGKRARVQTVASWFLTRSGLLAVVVAIIFCLPAIAIYKDRLSADVIAWAAAALFVIAWLPTNTGLLRGLGRNLTGQTAELLGRPLLTMLALYALYRAGILNIETALITQVLATGAVLLFCLSKVMRISNQRIAERPWNPPAKWASTSAAFFASALLQAINSNYPMIVASFFVSAADLGIFRVAVASTAIVSLPTAAANISMAPVIARLNAQGDHNALKRTIAHTTLATFLSTLAGIVVLAFAGRTLLGTLFGPAYVSAYTPLLVLSFAQVIVSAFGITGSFLNMTGSERLVIKAFAISVPIGLLATIPLTAVLGISGAAAGNVIMVSLWHWLVLYQHRQEVKIPMSFVSALGTLRRPCSI